MQEITDIHFREWFRFISQQCTLYTEMIHHNALIHNYFQNEEPTVIQDTQFHPKKLRRLLSLPEHQNKTTLQLGGSSPPELYQASLIARSYGYSEINLNVGCPSARVQEGNFGACLMKEPLLVRECVEAMHQAGVKVSVKCRLGVDESDSYEFVKDFIQTVSSSGRVSHFIIHARKAFLKGLNPAENRSVPPLMYDRVQRLAREFPELQFSINGGIKSLAAASNLLAIPRDEFLDAPKASLLHGCMIGRLAYENPYELLPIDAVFYHRPPQFPTRTQLLQKYADYLSRTIPFEKSEYDSLTNVSMLVKPILNLYAGVSNSSKYRMILSDAKKLKSEGVVEVVRQASLLMNSLSKPEPELTLKI